MDYTIKHHTGSDTKTIFDPAGRELITVQDLHLELNGLFARAESAEKMADYWKRRANETQQTDWNRARIEAATSAMHAILSSKNYAALLEFSEKSRRDAKAAVDYADSLVSELLDVME